MMMMMVILYQIKSYYTCMEEILLRIRTRDDGALYESAEKRRVHTLASQYVCIIHNIHNVLLIIHHATVTTASSKKDLSHTPFIGNSDSTNIYSFTQKLRCRRIRQNWCIDVIYDCCILKELTPETPSLIKKMFIISSRLYSLISCYYSNTNQPLLRDQNPEYSEGRRTHGTRAGFC